MQSPSCWRAIVVVACVAITALSGCSSILPSQKTPLENVIVATKQAITKSSEKTLFEEFVKYKEHHHTFDLYKLDSATLEAVTTVERSSSKTFGTSVSAQPSFWPTTAARAETTIAVKNSEQGKIMLTLSPLANDPGVYDEVKKIFNKIEYRSIYGIGDRDDCLKERKPFCFHLDGSRYAYLKNRDLFRLMIKEIDEL